MTVQENLEGDKKLLQPMPWAGLAVFLHDIEAKLETYANAAGTLRDEANLQVNLGLRELEQKWSEVQESLMHQGAKLRMLEQKALTAAGELRVQANLGHAEAMDAARELRAKLTQVERKVHNLRVKANMEARQALNAMATKCQDLSNRLAGDAHGPTH